MITEFTKRDKPRIDAAIDAFFTDCKPDARYVLEIKPKSKKRGLSANAYYWVLADKIAVASEISKTDVYRNHIAEIGGNSSILSIAVEAAESFCAAWESRGLGWLTDVLESSYEGFVDVIVYYGSSTYDRKQMSRLIELAIEDCKQYEIEYLTPRELAQMLDKWGDDE